MFRNVVLFALAAAGGASLALGQGMPAPIPCGGGALAACMPPPPRPSPTPTAVPSAVPSPVATAIPGTQGGPVPAPSPVPTPLNDAERAMRAHVMFLASDAMRGRDAGSAEYDIAAQYVAAQFYAAGLKPAGDAGDYLQQVPLVAYKAGDADRLKVTLASGRTLSLEPGKDFIPAADPEHAETRIAGDVVFVGQGIVAPDYGRDDYAGVDVTGKIVALVLGAPGNFDGEQRAHFGSLSTKAAIAAAHGATGVVVLVSGHGSFGYQRAGLRATAERFTWGNGDGTGHGDALPSIGTLSPAQSEAVFAGADTSYAAAMAATQGDGKEFRPVPLKASMSATLRTTMRSLMSSNVAGLLPGSDPKLAGEVVVLSAHLDHVGVGRPDAKGDTIYNGALDNAVGIASLIEEAKRFQASGKPPKRSILFLAVTAEEKGLIGSDYFARHPTLPRESLVADVNLDMPMIVYKFQDVIAFGAERSTLGPIVKRAAAAAGASFSPDPMPEQGLFVRSDHYRFVQQGIPSVFLWPGEAGPGKAASEGFLANHYHKPSDDLNQDPPIDWESGVRFINVNYQIAREIADAPVRPLWNKGDFFGTLYKGPGA